MMIKRGFSLIELLIATAISAFLIGALYQVIDQMRRNTTRIENTLDFVDRVILLENEFQRTFGGMMIPAISLSSRTGSTATDMQITTTQGPLKKEEKITEEKKKQPPPFFAELSAGRLVRCGCITTNALAVYGKSSALPVSVIYRVEPMANVPDRYRLIRQELQDYSLQDPEALKNAPSYELLDMITTISLRVVVRDPEKNDKKPVFIEHSPWDSVDEQHADILPEAVIIDCSWIHDGSHYAHTIYSPVHTAGWYWNLKMAEKKSPKKESTPHQGVEGAPL
jgi:prepilin-type N-terminal cleavage/methylation domain-containing protein